MQYILFGVHSVAEPHMPLGVPQHPQKPKKKKKKKKKIKDAIYGKL
jgi:hypothetical protein